MPRDRLYDPAQDKTWSSEVYHKAKQVIEESLSKANVALEFSVICEAMRQINPQLCDDNIKDRKNQKQSYWKHLVATAIQALKKEGKVDKASDGWIWATGKSPQLISQVATQPAPAPPISPPKRHDELKQKMVDMGRKLGYHTTTEESLGQYRPDVLWKRGPQRRDPCHVIEICAGGSLAKDFDSLNWAREDLEAKGILVTVDEPDYHRAVQRFGYHSQIVVAKAETVDRLHELIMTNLDFIKVLFREHS
jgi:hypothetical protein